MERRIMVVVAAAACACGNHESATEQHATGTATVVTVEGSVVDTSGQEVDGLLVEVLDADTAAIVTTTLTQPAPDDPKQNNMHVDLATGHRYAFRVSDPTGGYVTTFWAGTDASGVTPIAPDSSAGYPFEIDRTTVVRSTATLHGTVQVAETFAPADGVTVRAYDPATLAIVAQATTATDGTFDMAVPTQPADPANGGRALGLRFDDPSGRFAPAYAGADLSRGPSLPNAGALTFSNEQSRKEIFTVQRATVRVTGTVVGPDQTPSAGATCSARDMTTGLVLGTATTDASGGFEIDLARPIGDDSHDTAVRCQDLAGAAVVGNDVYLSWGARDFDEKMLVLQAPAAGGPATAHVTGTLLGWLPKEQIPAAGVSIDALAGDGGVAAHTVTDATGGFAFDVAPGQYRLAVADPGGIGPWAPVVLLSGGWYFYAGANELGQQSIQRAIGTVHQQSWANAGVPYAVVDEATFAVIASGNANDQGTIDQPVPSARPYTVRLGGGTFGIAQQTLEVAPAAEVDLSLSVNSALGLLHVTVDSGTSFHQITADVQVYDAATFIADATTTSTVNEKNLLPLPPGQYVAIASAAGYASQLFAGSQSDPQLPLRVGSLQLIADSQTDAFVTLKPIPRADAGPDQAVREGDAVVLDASNSSDVEGNLLKFAWTQIAGPPVTPTIVCDATSCGAKIQFIAPAVPTSGAVITFAVDVTNGYIDRTDTVDVIVSHINRAPIAAAGTNQTVDEGSTVQLDGTQSYDLDGDALHFSWVQTAGPSVTLATPAAATTSFIAPLVGQAPVTLAFDLHVSDAVSESIASVQVTVENVNHPPAANAGADFAILDNAIAQLDGTASSDPDGDPLTYHWTQISGPAVTISNPTSATPTFAAPAVTAPTTLEVELTVSDGEASSSDRVDVVVSPHGSPPRCDFATATPAMVWPPDRRLIAVQIGGVTSADGDAITTTVTGILQDEPRGTDPDGAIVGGVPYVRADRAGSGDGRVYRIQFRATNRAGSCSGEVRTCVRHDAAAASCGAGPSWYASY